jgi:hypothetical protein
MAVFHLRERAGRDGHLRLSVPAATGEYDVTVTVSERPPARPTSSVPTTSFKSTGDPILDELIRTAPERGWPPGFIEATMGSVDDSFMRHPQGEYEERIPLE